MTLEQLSRLCAEATPHWHEVSFDPGFYWDGNPDNATEQPRPPAVLAEGERLSAYIAALSPERVAAMIAVIEAAQTYSDDMERQGGSNPSNMRSALAQLEKALA